MRLLFPLAATLGLSLVSTVPVFAESCAVSSCVARQAGARSGSADPNHYPSVNIFKQSGRVGEPFVTIPLATDEDGDELKYTLIKGPLPAGLTFDLKTGVISGIPTAPTAFTEILYSVTDGKGNAGTFFDFTIREALSTKVTTNLDPQNSSAPDPNDFDGVTTLREAINFANSNSDESAITFDLPADHRTLSLVSSLPLLTTPLSITGPLDKGVRIERSSADGTPAFTVLSVQGASVELSNMTIAGGDANGPNGHNGGGIFNSNGALILKSCTLTNNRALYGGALYSTTPNGLPTAYTRLYNCTISGNTALGTDFLGGGSLYNGDGSMVLDSCTVTQNRSPEGTSAGLVSNVGGNNRIQINNSILAGNLLLEGTAPNADVAVGQGNQSQFVSQGHNLVGSGNAVALFTATGDQVGVTGDQLKLGALTENGGPTPTMRLLAGSPALNAGLTQLSIDQRGFPRPAGLPKDIGAFENQELKISEVTVTPSAPFKNDVLTAEPKVINLEDRSVTFSYQWLRTRGDTTEVLPVTGNQLDTSLSSISVGDILTVKVVASGDGFNSEPVSASVTIQNSPITITSIKLQPSQPYTFDQMFVTVQTADLDKTRPFFSYTWTKNGEVVKTVTGSRIGQNFFDLKAPGHGDKGDVIEVTVTVTDDPIAETATTATAKASATIRNSVPVLSLLTLTPEAPTPQNVITSNFGGRDADGDKLTKLYIWKIGKKVLPEEKSARLNLAKYPFVKVGDVVSLEMRLSDGEALSRTRIAQVTVVAATPPATLTAPVIGSEASGNAS